MLNPHPLLTHFPIALVIVAALTEALALLFRSDKAARFSHPLLLATAIIAPMTYYSGFWGEDFAKFVAEDFVEKHEEIALLFLYSLAPTVLLSFLRLSTKLTATTKRIVTAAFLLCLSISATLVGLTGYRGGEIVFEHGGGIKPELLRDEIRNSVKTESSS